MPLFELGFWDYLGSFTQQNKTLWRNKTNHILYSDTKICVFKQFEQLSTINIQNLNIFVRPT